VSTLVLDFIEAEADGVDRMQSIRSSWCHL